MLDLHNTGWLSTLHARVPKHITMILNRQISCHSYRHSYRRRYITTTINNVRLSASTANFHKSKSGTHLGGRDARSVHGADSECAQLRQRTKQITPFAAPRNGNGHATRGVGRGQVRQLPDLQKKRKREGVCKYLGRGAGGGDDAVRECSAFQHSVKSQSSPICQKKTTTNKREGAKLF